MLVRLFEKKIAFYAREIREALPQESFQPVPNRIVWLAAHWALVALGIVTIAGGIGGWWLTLPASILIGSSFASLTFVAHEVMHGAVVRSHRLQLVLGWLGFLPFTLSPRLWAAWHNRAHHGRTMSPSGADPDSGTTLAVYRANRATRFFDHLTIGRRRPGGIFTILIGFNGQALRVLFSMARQLNYLSRGQFVLALLETLLGIAVWVALAWWIGAAAFTFAFLIPLVIANVIVMSYIMTNHNLSPLTETNDPLLNTLTVTTPRLFEIAHLNFGYHVEHHLFPKMSSRYAKQVRAELLERWPERYQSLSLPRALLGLWTTTRIYSSDTVLHDPRTGMEWPTLQPARQE